MLALAPPPAPIPPVIYEANLRAFAPGHGFAAVEARLGAIRRLGTDVLWLMPIHPVGKTRSAGGIGSPYAVADYDRVNPEFGTDADLRRLVNSAHKRGMRVILDWVGNHTAWDHPWISAHPEWYTRDAKGTIQIPRDTNWNDVADLNFDSTPMRAAMIASMRGWVARFGVDGFRCDYADGVPADFWRAAVADLRRTAKRPLLMLAEGAREDHRASGFDLTYGWAQAYRTREAFAGKSAKPVVPAMIADGPHALRFSTNHDWSAWDGSLPELYRTPAGIRTAFALATVGGGATLVYSGQEAGHPGRIPIFDRSAVDWTANSGEALWIASVLKARRECPVLRGGTTLDLSTEDLVAFRRIVGKETALVVANPRERTLWFELPAADRGAWRDAFSGESRTLGATLELPPGEHRVLLRKMP